MITNEALFVLRNQLAFTKRVNRQYDAKFGVDGAKIGTVLNVRKPPRYLGRTGPALSVEDATETSVPLALNTQAGVDINFTTSDLLLNIDQFSERLIQPAVANVANRIDADGMKQYVNVANYVGTPGTVPNALLTYLTAGALLDIQATPMDGRRAVVLGPIMQATIVDALKGLFQSATQIKDQYEKGQMGTVAGFDWYMDQNTPSHKIGTFSAALGSPAVGNALQTGSSLGTTGWTAADVLNAGDIITLDGVDSVNPQNRQDSGQLQGFVVTALATADNTGAMTIPIWPPITPAGAFQTVSASPASGAKVHVFGASATATPQGLAFHRDAFTLATADLPLPGGVDMAARSADPELGISIRLVRAYDINTDKLPFEPREVQTQWVN